MSRAGGGAERGGKQEFLCLRLGRFLALAKWAGGARGSRSGGRGSLSWSRGLGLCLSSQEGDCSLHTGTRHARLPPARDRVWGPAPRETGRAELEGAPSPSPGPDDLPTPRRPGQPRGCRACCAETESFRESLCPRPVGSGHSGARQPRQVLLISPGAGRDRDLQFLQLGASPGAHLRRGTHRYAPSPGG